MTAPDRRQPPRDAIEVVQAKRVLGRLPRLPQGGTLAEKLAVAAPAAVEVMYELLEIGEPREQADASRVLIGAAVALGKGTPSGVVAGSGENMTDDQRLEALRACLRSPDPVLLAALRAERDAVIAAVGAGS